MWLGRGWIIKSWLVRIQWRNRRKGDLRIEESLQKQELKILNNYHTQYLRWQQKVMILWTYHLLTPCGIESCPICSLQEIWEHLLDDSFVCSVRTFWRTERMLCRTLRTWQHRRLLLHLLFSKMETLRFLYTWNYRIGSNI
jgi:hypothetical protein